MPDKDYTWDRIGKQILVAASVAAISAVVTKAVTGNWNLLLALKRLPFAVKVAVGVMVGLWVLYAIIRSRKSKRDTGIGVYFIPNAPWGWSKVLEGPHAGVIWRVQAPNPPPWEEGALVSPESLDVVTPPRCPNCLTEIEEHQRLIGGYEWRCVACDFRKRNPESYHREAERVIKIAKRRVEKEVEDQIARERQQGLRRY